MNLSLAEAAIALGQTERQVRYLIKTGRLVAKKGDGGRWVIASEALPLSEGQRRAMAERAATARQAVEKAIAPVEKAAATRVETATNPKRSYSVNDFQAFQIGSALLRETVAALGKEDPATHRLFDALARLTRGCHAFQPEEKAARFTESRELAADVVSHLLLDGEETVRRDLADRLEQTFIPKLAALVASQEKRTHKNRFDRFGSFAPRRSGA
ncbi:MAG: hypothetical protein HQL81_13685 [Magnetococcales bacterium]|nr:hypothetical protein [Magnetococcales bacterium]